MQNEAEMVEFEQNRRMVVKVLDAGAAGNFRAVLMGSSDGSRPRAVWRSAGWCDLENAR